MELPASFYTKILNVPTLFPPLPRSYFLGSPGPNEYERDPLAQIVANPSDLKHVVELLGCSDGLGMVILAGTRRGIGFY